MVNKDKFSQIYTSAKYVRQGDLEGNLTDEIAMIEAVKAYDGLKDYIVKSDGDVGVNNYYAALEAAHNDSDDPFTIAAAD